MSRSSPSSIEPVLELRGIAKRFGPTQALRGVDLQIAKGETFSLVGESGCGKSTVARLVVEDDHLVPGRDERAHHSQSAAHGKIRSILRQSFWAAAHLLVQSGA